ncbi:MAG: tRNA (5-methylaminomethyl-2-thiouridine)(34)-methyltransferase MnmD [Granulosicoccus sp.]
MVNEAVLTADGSCTLNSQRYGETYHSTFGALTEARHVFLNATGVSNRLEQGLPTRILEIGFGLGLNALLTADLARQSGTPLVFHSFEHDLVTPETIMNLGYASLMSDRKVFDALLQGVKQMHKRREYSAHNSITHRFPLADNIQLVIHLEDATRANLQTLGDNDFHAIYLDAFSPDTNAECWNPAFIDTLAGVLSLDGSMSTYSAKGDVRRAMLAANLIVKKLPGPPGKREMLVGQHRSDKN